MRTRPRFGRALAATLWALALPACPADEWHPEDLSLGTRPIELAMLAEGREGYATYCVGCHGETGDGNGPAARFLDPKPRDFRAGKIKFAAVPAGSPALDEDYLRVITNGLHGSAMPAFELVGERERRAMVAYIRTFFTGAAEKPEPALALGADPFTDTPSKAVALGRDLFHGLAGCWNCHPAYVSRPEIVKAHDATKVSFSDFRDDLYGAAPKPTEWGAPIRATDFLSDRVKTGFAAESIARVISAGITGTAMPTWGFSLTNDQLWALAHYVRSLALLRDTPAASALRRGLAAQPPYAAPKAPPKPPAPASAEPGTAAPGTGAPVTAVPSTSEGLK